MTAYVLIPGAGGDAWYWHLLEPELRGRGHDVVAVDLPTDDDSAGLAEYADAALGEPPGYAKLFVRHLSRKPESIPFLTGGSIERV